MSLNSVLQTVRAWFNDYTVEPLLGFWLGLGPRDKPVFCVLLATAALVGFVVGRRGRARLRRFRGFQNEGEALVSRVLRSEFGPPDYHLMNHVTLPMGDGTTEVDHILVSRFGVFVIETKHYSGWLFGSAGGRKWTQVLFRSRFRFQNPLFQNNRHIRAVQGVLDFLPPEAVRAVVVFSGKGEFKTEIPRGVVKISELSGYVRMQTEEVMSLKKLQFCVGCLETARLAISAQTDVEHVERLARRHGAGA